MKINEPLGKLALYFEQCAFASIALQMGNPIGKQYFEIRKAFGIEGYRSKEECLTLIKKALK